MFLIVKRLILWKCDMFDVQRLLMQRRVGKIPRNTMKVSINAVTNWRFPSSERPWGRRDWREMQRKHKQTAALYAQQFPKKSVKEGRSQAHKIFLHFPET